jgi:hypothetical protein
MMSSAPALEIDLRLLLESLPTLRAEFATAGSNYAVQLSCDLHSHSPHHALFCVSLISSSYLSTTTTHTRPSRHHVWHLRTPRPPRRPNGSGSHHQGCRRAWSPTRVRTCYGGRLHEVSSCCHRCGGHRSLDRIGMSMKIETRQCNDIY